MIALSFWKERIMSEFMLTLFLGNIFVMAITILLIGFMFVLRVMLNLWFDTDFFKKIVGWFKEMDERVKRQLDKKDRKLEKQIKEANTILVIDEGEEDVFEQE